MELFIALRYLRGKRKLGFISFITYISSAGVLLGSFVLIVALAVANGFKKEVRDRIVGTLAHGKILLYHSNPIENYDSLRAVIASCPKVKAAAPFLSGKGGVEYDATQEGVEIMGVDAERETTVTDLGTKIKYGVFRLDSAESKENKKRPGIVIGIGLADKLGVRQGNEIVLISLATNESDINPTPRMERYTVTGIFETGMYEYDLNLVYISIASAQSLFGVTGVEGIQFKTEDIFTADRTAREVEKFLGGYPYRSVDWKSQNRSLFEWMNLEKLVIFIVISLIIVVAAFNIVSSLIMMILEKKREIGILMGMGTTSAAIMRVFMFNGIVIGFLGSTIGTILGVALCYVQFRWQLIPLPGDIYFINRLPVLIKPYDVGGVYIASNLICWLATLYPAWRASKVLPAESIRSE